MSTKVFGTYDQAELDRQYNNAAWVPDAKEIIGRYRTDSDAVHARLKAKRDLRYDKAPGATLDYFPARAKGAPLQIFVHGGQWQQLAKEDSAFAAETFVARGAAFAALNFDLIPQVTLDEIVRQVRAAVLWLQRDAGRLGHDPQRMFLTGHSSGGHLAGMMATTDWAALGARTPPLSGIVAVSGMYDLDPVMKTFRRDYLKLDAEGTRRNSPIRHLQRVAAPVVVAYGALETDEFRRQGEEFASRLCAAAKEAEALSIKGKNHFDVISTLADPASPLARAVLGQMRL